MHADHGNGGRAVDARIDRHPRPAHRHQDIAQNAGGPSTDRPQELRRLAPGADPQGPFTQAAAPPLGDLGGENGIRPGDVKLDEAGLPGHGDDVTGQDRVGRDIDAAVGTGRSTAVCRNIRAVLHRKTRFPMPHGFCERV